MNQRPAADEKPGVDPLLANGLRQSLRYNAMKSQEADDAYVVQSVYRYHTGIRPDLDGAGLAARAAQVPEPATSLRTGRGADTDHRTR